MAAEEGGDAGDRWVKSVWQFVEEDAAPSGESRQAEPWLDPAPSSFPPIVVASEQPAAAAAAGAAAAAAAAPDGRKKDVKRRRGDVGAVADANTIRRRRITSLIAELGQLTGVRSSQVDTLEEAKRLLLETAVSSCGGAVRSSEADGARRVLEEVPAMSSSIMLVVDEHMKVLDANDTFFRVLGYTADDLRSGLTPLDLHDEASAVTLRAAVRLAQGGRVRRMRNTSQWKHRDGTLSWWSAAIDLGKRNKDGSCGRNKDGGCGGIATIVAVPHAALAGGSSIIATLEVLNPDGTVQDVTVSS